MVTDKVHQDHNKKKLVMMTSSVAQSFMFLGTDFSKWPCLRPIHRWWDRLMIWRTVSTWPCDVTPTAVAVVTSNFCVTGVFPGKGRSASNFVNVAIKQSFLYVILECPNGLRPFPPQKSIGRTKAHRKRGNATRWRHTKISVSCRAEV